MRIDIGKYIETMGTGTINGGANVIDNVNVSQQCHNYAGGKHCDESIGSIERIGKM